MASLFVLTMATRPVIISWLYWMFAMITVSGLNTTSHQELLAKLTYPSYDAGVRPSSDGPPVVVEVDVVFISVGPVNELDMTWTASFYLRQEWTDKRLVLERRTSSVVKLAGDSVKKLWLPDLYFSNNKQGHKHYITVPNHLVYVNSSTGRLLYSQRLTLVLNCEMDLIKFPHDNQTCDMKMESYSHTTADLVFRWSSSRVATSLLPTAYIPDFQIQDVYTIDCTTVYALGTYPCLQATVRMDREIGFYLFQTYLPSILIVILSWASFWIDHEAVPARISVGLLTVLTITTQLSGSRAQLPRVPYIKAIDVWMSTNLVFVFAAYMEYAVVTVLSRRYKKGLARKIQRETEQENQQLSSQDDDSPSSSSHTPPSSKTNGHAAKSSSSTTSTPTRQPPLPSPFNHLLDNMDSGRKVDKMSRVMFPLVYAIFNVVYWIYYLVVA